MQSRLVVIASLIPYLGLMTLISNRARIGITRLTSFRRYYVEPRLQAGTCKKTSTTGSRTRRSAAHFTEDCVAQAAKAESRPHRYYKQCTRYFERGRSPLGTAPASIWRLGNGVRRSAGRQHSGESPRSESTQSRLSIRGSVLTEASGTFRMILQAECTRETKST